MRRLWVVGLAAALAACGGSSTKAPQAVTVTTAAQVTTTTQSLSDLSARYQGAVQPGNDALAVFRDAYKKLPSTASAAQIAVIAAPVVVAFKQVDRNLLSIGWPAPIRSDVDALVKADATYEVALDSLTSESGQQFSTAVSQLNVAANIVRRDLGLPLLTAGL